MPLQTKYMIEQVQERHNVLYVIACAALPAQHLHEFVLLAQQTRWDVCVIATKQALKFLDPFAE